jgi:hypothetical protein
VTDQLLASGFKAVIVAAPAGVLPPCLIGGTLDAGVIDEIEAAGATPAGATRARRISAVLSEEEARRHPRPR